MKKSVILLLLLLCSSLVFSQALSGPQGYGKLERRFKATNFLGMPVTDTVCDLVENTTNGTCEGAVVYRTADSTVYVRTATYWRPLAKGGDLSDYYTKEELQSGGAALVYYSNIFGLNGPKLLGRYSASTGVMEDINIGAGLTLNSSTGVLTGLSLNGQTGATQSFSVGTSGTNFAISSSGNNHTFNIPDASATARGLVTTNAQTFAGSKTFGNNINVQNVPAMGSAASTFLTLNGSVLNTRTVAQVLSDIGGAPSTGSTNYIQNTTSMQASSNFSISGIGQANQFEVLKDGSASAAPHYVLKDAAATERASLQLTENVGAFPALAIRVGGGDRIRVTSIGNTSIGFPAAAIPFCALHVASNQSSHNIMAQYTGPSGAWISASSTGVPVSGDHLGTFSLGSFVTSTTYRPGSLIKAYAEGTWTDGVTHPSSLRFYTTGNASSETERMRITQLGRVGIGTNDPQTALHVFGDGYITSRNLQSDNGSSLTLWGQGATSNIIFANGATSTEQMRLTSSGALAIGTTDPFGALHVKRAAALLNVQNTNAYSGSSGGSIYMLNSGTPSAGSQKIGAIIMAAAPTDANPQPGAMIDAFTDGAGWTVGSSIPTYMRFLTGSTSSGSPVERLRINAAGNVLIGTTTDGGQKLQVSGTASISSTATVQKIVVTTPTAYDITHNNQSIAKDATTNELVPYDGVIADYVTLSANTTLNTAEFYIKSNSTAYTVTVPSASANPGRVYVIKNSGNTTNDITLNVTTNSQTIDGVNTNVAITPGVWIRIISNGTAWFKIGG